MTTLNTSTHAEKAAERYDQGVGPSVPDQKDREKEGIGVMMGHVCPSLPPFFSSVYLITRYYDLRGKAPSQTSS